MAHDSSLGGPRYKTTYQVPVYGKDTALGRPATVPLHVHKTSGMLFTKRRSQFTPDAVYILVIKKRDGYNPSIGFFHHRKYETGFLAYAESASEIRTVKVGRSTPSFVS